MQPHRLQSARLLCPWDFPGKNIGVNCHFLLQGIFLTQIKLASPILQAVSCISGRFFTAEPPGKPQLDICSTTKDNRTTSTWQKRQRSSLFKNPTPSIVTHKWAGFHIYRDLFLVTQDGKESACSAEDPGSIPGLGRSPGERNGNPLKYSCLGNPMDRGAWQTTVHGVTKSWT